MALNAPALVNGFGYDKSNTRSLTAQQAGLTKGDLSELELAWAIAIPGGATMRTQPAVVGTTVSLPVADVRAVYALDVSQPRNSCVKWVFKTGTESPLRSSASYGVLAGRRGVLAFTAFHTTVYLLDAETGKAIWTKHVGTTYIRRPPVAL